MVYYFSCSMLFLFIQYSGVATAFDGQGITFKMANSSHFQQIHQLLEEDFFPDEPMSRSCGSTQSAYYWTWVWVEKALLKFQTVVALDQNGTVIGVNLGKDEEKEEAGTAENGKEEDAEKDKEGKSVFWCPDCTSLWEYQIHLMWILKTFFGSLTPSYFGNPPESAVYNKASEVLGYKNITKLMSELKCKRMYDLFVLSVRRSARVRGLGTELVRIGEEEARGRGCGCARVFATSRFSARIFDKLGWTQTGKLRYDDFVDEEGDIILKETGDHKKMVTFSKVFS